MGLDAIVPGAAGTVNVKLVAGVRVVREDASSRPLMGVESAA
jgi:hypothetical protein